MKRRVKSAVTDLCLCEGGGDIIMSYHIMSDTSLESLHSYFLLSKQCSPLHFSENCLEYIYVQTRSIMYTDNVKYDWRHTHSSLSSAVCLT